MFEKNLKLAYLLDFYGDVLDEHTRKTMHSYYYEDLSLSEIAEGLSISRQGVRHIIKKGEDQVLFLEEKLGLASRHNSLVNLADRIKEIIVKIDTGIPLDTDDTSSLRDIVDTILTDKA